MNGLWHYSNEKLQQFFILACLLQFFTIIVKTPEINLFHFHTKLLLEQEKELFALTP